MALFGSFANVPTGAVHFLQSTGTKGDIILAPINWNQSGISTGTVPGGGGTNSLQRFFLTMGG